ncbi:ATPase [Marinobacterium aestuariivivens]|uniref:ATPase n=1 Tax=Marinobacterium aestuariivivens TaxID=1698799 RepID=A0ABW1ZTV4_9GAMM
MTDDRKRQAPLAANGVERLIERLRDEGVAEGRASARRIVEEAEARARWLLQQAEEEAELVRRKARDEAGRYREAADQALKVAARDAVLGLKATLSQQFNRELDRQVAAQMRSDGLLRELILAVAGRTRDYCEPAERIEILLPRRAFGFEEMRRDPESVARGELTALVRELIGESLRDGVSFSQDDDDTPGLRIRLSERGITIDLTAASVAELLRRSCSRGSGSCWRGSSNRCRPAMRC